jgi:hypothetical protein
MLTLDPRSRTALAGAALLAFAGAVAHDPIAARSVSPPAMRMHHDVLAAQPRIAVVVPRRNPFDGETLSSAESTSPPLPLPPVPAVLAPLPPNAGIAAGGSAERLTAIVSGTHPYALLEAANGTRVVTVGERIGGAPILAIGIDGVRLGDGRTLSVGAVTPSALAVPPALVPSPPSRTPLTLGGSL